MISTLQISNEETERRRQLTNFTLKLMLFGVGVALMVQFAYYWTYWKTGL